MAISCFYYIFHLLDSIPQSTLGRGGIISTGRPDAEQRMDKTCHCVTLVACIAVFSFARASLRR